MTLSTYPTIESPGGVAAVAGQAASPRSLATGNSPATASSSGNDSTPVTTETYVSEIFIPCTMTITGIAVFCGSVTTGNVTVGLADANGQPIAEAKSASTAVPTADVYQRIPFAAPYVAKGPAMHFIQVQYDSTSHRYNTHTVGNHAVMKQTSQTYGTFTSFTVPTTFVTNIGNIASLY
jgi:hypothetical protein